MREPGATEHTGANSNVFGARAQLAQLLPHYMCGVLILLYMCPHTALYLCSLAGANWHALRARALAAAATACLRPYTPTYVGEHISSARILLYMCSHSALYCYIHICSHTALYVCSLSLRRELEWSSRTCSRSCCRGRRAAADAAWS